MSADVYERTLVSDGGEQYYEWTSLYYAQDDAAVVDIDPRLRSARAVAALQTESDTVAVTVDWTGTGARSTYRSHAQGSTKGREASFYNDHYLDSSRRASAVGVFDAKTLSGDYGFLGMYKTKSVSH